MPKSILYGNILEYNTPEKWLLNNPGDNESTSPLETKYFKLSHLLNTLGNGKNLPNDLTSVEVFHDTVNK